VKIIVKIFLSGTSPITRFPQFQNQMRSKNPDQYDFFSILFDQNPVFGARRF
jgi:hypothetical protein